MKQPERLVIGTVLGAFGVRGELKVRIETDFPERFLRTERVSIAGHEYAVERARLHRGMALLKLGGVDTADGAQHLRKHAVEVELSDAVPLPEGTHYIYEIEGLKVQTTDGEYLGVIAEVMRTGANDVYVVRAQDGSELLLPAIPLVVKSLDLQSGVMIVELLDGLR